MANLSIAGLTIKPIVEANPGDGTAWTDGNYYALAPLGMPPLEMDPEYEEMPVAFAGVGGMGTKQLGFRGRDINFDMIFLGADESTVQTARNAMITTLQAGRFNCTVPGGTQRNNCRLKRGGFRETRWFVIGQKHALQCAVQVRQLDLAVAP